MEVRKVVTMDEWITIKTLYNKGYSIRKIAKTLHKSRNTIRKYLKDSNIPKYTKTEKYITKSKWSQYEENIMHMYYVKKFIGSRIYEELKKLGAKGSKTGFYEYFKKIKKQNNSRKIHQRYETGPGIQAQFDWSEYTLKIGNYIKKVYIFSIILSFSRVKYFIASYDMKQFSIFTAIEKAFRYFNGSTEFLLIDNKINKIIVFIFISLSIDIMQNIHKIKFHNLLLNSFFNSS